MKATVRTNIDPWSNVLCPELEIGKSYEVDKVIISGWYTDVYLEGLGSYNSTMFDDEFQEAFDEALEWFSTHKGEYYYGHFVRDYC